MINLIGRADSLHYIISSIIEALISVLSPRYVLP